MPAPQFPGVFIEEPGAAAAPNAAVDLSTAAFIGIDPAPAGPGQLKNFIPRRVDGAVQALALLGPPVAGTGGAPRRSLLPDAIRLYFDNGGRAAWLLRLPNAAPATLARGLEQLRKVPAATLAAPDVAALPAALREAAQRALIGHCELAGDRLAVLDAPADAGVDALLAQARALATPAAALYAPWMLAADSLLPGRSLALPPSAAVAGVYAAVERNRGVYRAPANEALNGANGLTAAFNDAAAARLTPAGVNLLRAFAGRGVLVWGARTLAPAAEARYVNVARALIYLGRSIAAGLAWTALEADGDALRSRVRTMVEDFLLNEWRNGGLLGTRPAQAFFARCDSSTTTAADGAAGRLVLQLGVALLRPAEFIPLRVTLRTAV